MTTEEQAARPAQRTMTAARLTGWAATAATALSFSPAVVPFGEAFAWDAPGSAGGWLGRVLAPPHVFAYPLLGGMLAVLATGFLLVAMLDRHYRAAAPWFAVYLAAFTLGCVAEPAIRDRVGLTPEQREPRRREGLARAARRARPLVAAIEAYRRENGRPPSSLEELVPSRLPAVPHTGLAAYPRFEYRLSGERARFRVYELRVKTPHAFLDFDRFVYWPEGGYPAGLYGADGGGPERIDGWAYVDE